MASLGGQHARRPARASRLPRRPGCPAGGRARCRCDARPDPRGRRHIVTDPAADRLHPLRRGTHTRPGPRVSAGSPAAQHVSLEWDERGGVTVHMDGSPQSHVQPDDPTLLVFEYVQHLALAIDALPAGPLGVTHVGGAGLTLPRWVEATRPGSPQIVLEPDEALTDLVRREIPLPRRHRIRVRPVDGLTGVRALKDDSADVVVTDAYAGGRVP